MKVEVGLDGNIELTNVFNSIVLKTDSGESLAICMRDSGFEFKYQGKWYSAKEGRVKSFEDITKEFRKQHDELRDNERL